MSKLEPDTSEPYAPRMSGSREATTSSGTLMMNTFSAASASRRIIPLPTELFKKKALPQTYPRACLRIPLAAGPR